MIAASQVAALRGGLFFVSIAASIGYVEVVSPDAGSLMVIDDTRYRGRVEPRIRLKEEKT